ncbi:MAG: 6-phosphogluconolactonase [Pseudomonadota bacterium]
MSLDLKEFASAETLAESLAERVATGLRAAIDKRGTASLAVSGGSTPALFFAHLCRQELAWDRVTITLVDERWVPETDDRSNAAMVRRSLLRDRAEPATFRALYTGAPTPEVAVGELETALSPVIANLDMVILGMGTDGHTASLFPGGDRLRDALDPNGAALLSPMNAPGTGEPRITLTVRALQQAHACILHIQGAEKRTVLDQAIATKDPLQYPICAMAARSDRPLVTYWSE